MDASAFFFRRHLVLTQNNRHLLSGIKRIEKFLSILNKIRELATLKGEKIKGRKKK